MTSYRKLLTQSRKDDFDFLVHVGDFKAQGVQCSNAEFVKVRDVFKAYPEPVVYTPGDNEWTDCHGVGADPIERLGKLRSLFFANRSVLRLDKLKVVRDSNRNFVENFRFIRSKVMFIVVHVCGSGNNRRTGVPSAMREHAERVAANKRFLNESFNEALSLDVAGVAIVIHANPDFERGAQVGYREFLNTLRGFLGRYRKSVVCIHGDSHYFRVDKPLRDSQGNTVMHFTRVEVFGSPDVAGVAVTVDPSDNQVFRARPYRLK